MAKSHVRLLLAKSVNADELVELLRGHSRSVDDYLCPRILGNVKRSDLHGIVGSLLAKVLDDSTVAPVDSVIGERVEVLLPFLIQLASLPGAQGPVWLPQAKPCPW